ncbi:MAG: GNAT family N-acetyltransferase [Gemmatimonadaceae bacterium]|nr:GNAT family N-acetyltransferase [Gemmatimonadaceae bacterium]
MAFARNWKQNWAADGPHRATEKDITLLNRVFSEAFTERYRKDGMLGVRVPHLNPTIWKFAIADAGDGAMIWRDEGGAIAAFNIVHRSGIEGWMGPLVVHPDHQGRGIGKTIVNAGVEWLKSRGAKVIGLETMPRTMDNVGFYSALGMLPWHLTVTVTIEGALSASAPESVARIPQEQRESAIEECRVLTESLLPGHDFTREIALTDKMQIGDTVLLHRGGELTGFALCHTVPLVDGRVREELRVLKLVARSEDDFDLLVVQLASFCRRCGTRRLAIRAQGSYPEIYRRLIMRGGRVRWTDLRMTVHGFSETVALRGVVLSNWEI